MFDAEAQDGMVLFMQYYYIIIKHQQQLLCLQTGVFRPDLLRSGAASGEVPVPRFQKPSFGFHRVPVHPGPGFRCRSQVGSRGFGSALSGLSFCGQVKFRKVLGSEVFWNIGFW